MREPGDALHVALTEQHVGDVADFFARHDMQHLRFQFAQRQPALLRFPAFLPPRTKRDVVGLARDHRRLELTHPWPDRQAHLGQAVLPHVDVHLFLDREAEAHDAVIERHGAHAKCRLVDQYALARFARAELFASEGFATAKTNLAQPASGVELARVDGEVGIVLHQVPGIRGELVLDLRHEALRPEEVHRRLASEPDAQPPVEAHEVIHVAVAHENMRQPQELARGERREIAQVEQQGALLEQDVDVQTRVAERRIDQRRLEDGSHAAEGGLMRLRYYGPICGSPWKAMPAIAPSRSRALFCWASGDSKCARSSTAGWRRINAGSR